MGGLHFKLKDAVNTVDLGESEVPAVRYGVGPEFDPTGRAAEQTASARSHSALAWGTGGRCSRITESTEEVAESTMLFAGAHQLGGLAPWTSLPSGHLLYGG